MKKFSVIIIALALMAPAPELEAQLEIVTDSSAKPEYVSSLNCAKCHLDIHNYWKDSLHANALEDNVFQAAFMIALKQEGDEVRGICLDCHAPTTLATKDMMLELPLSSEAITCDFCHRTFDVNLGNGEAQLSQTLGDEKYGPLEPTGVPESHPSVQSALFNDSRLCATCHQWTNPQGVAIFDTFREWLNGPFPAQGVHCQNCHMPLVEGSLVTGRPRKPGEKINSHNLSGGHSIEQVASAAKVRIASVSRVTGGLHAVVEVSNVGSGHMIPTGIPSRALVLEAQLLDSKGNLIESEKHTFRRVILDSQHNELTADADIILNGALISKDNRIPPGGTVAVPFDFAAAAGQKYLVRATLRYMYRPLVLQEEQIDIEMGSDSKSP